MRLSRAQHSATAVLGLAILLVAACASAEVVRWDVDGTPRQAIVYAPDPLPPGETVPLVFVFHGFGDHMQNFQHTGVHQAWPEAVVAYPEGLVRRRGLLGWQVEPDDRNRDLRFVDTMLASMREQYPIDDDRIYAAGFSNGGMFTYLLWAERPDVFAAYAPVAARLRGEVRPSVPRPLFHIAGERDMVVRYPDQEAAIAVAREVNGSDAPVETWIHAGAHTWPRATSARIVEFLRQHVGR